MTTWPTIVYKRSYNESENAGNGHGIKKRLTFESNLARKEALESFYNLKALLVKHNPQALSNIFNVECDLYQAMDNCKKQSKITDFFKKF